jgi:phospholipase/lecithinase/hemolysin
MALDIQPTSHDSLECCRTTPCDGGRAPPQLARSRRRAALRFGAIATIASAIALAAAIAPAQAQFTSITDFGDSYADTGSAPGGAFRLAVPPFYNPCPPGYTSCRFTGGTNLVDSLQSIFGLPTATNYAIGGARTDDTNTISGLSDGFTYELQQFAASGTHFTNSDLIALSIGGNDLSVIANTALIPSGAMTSAQNAVAGVEQLVAAGADNIA